MSTEQAAELVVAAYNRHVTWLARLTDPEWDEPMTDTAGRADETWQMLEEAILDLAVSLEYAAS